MDVLINNYILIWVGILGLCLGSFYNVVILRSLSNESIIYPPSKCPKCNNKLKPWHNIPVLSFLFLGGKCAFCKEKISIQYPIIELLTMFLFCLSYIKFGFEWKTIFSIILSSCLLIMTITDLKEKLVDCNIAIGLGIAGIIYNWLINGDILNCLYGLIAGIAIMEILARFGYFVSKNRAFGEADTYVAGALGACFGLNGLFYVLFYTLIASMFFIIPIFIYKQFQKNNKYVCILSILFILSVLIHKSLIQNWYTIIALLLTGILLTTAILRNLKEDSSPIYLPLVPAFSLGALYFLFF